MSPRDLLAVGSLGVTLLGVYLQFGLGFALITAGIAGCAVAVVWAIVAMKAE